MLENPFLKKILLFLSGGFTSLVLQFLILYYLFEYLHINYLVAVTMATLIGILYGFYFQKKFVFKSESPNYHKQILLFFINGVVNYVLTITIIYLLVE